MSYELFKQGPEVYVPIILLSLVITVLAYGAFPFILAKARSTLITKKKYRGLCYGINAAVMVLFIVINGEASSGGPYVLWTWVFSNWGIRILNNKGLLNDDTNIPCTLTHVTDQSKPTFEARKDRFCRECGAKLVDNSRFCCMCGTNLETVSNATQQLGLCDIENAVSIYLNKRISISHISCTLVYVIPASTGKPKEMHLAMTVGDEEFSSLDLMFFDQNRKSYYLYGERLALDEPWLPKEDVFSFDTSLFKTFNTEVDEED